ncbi:putative inorganic phosphate cotransporter isoform X2 [Choristoneura fumiferana]|uniref:putative inorganic phosphate cotransporter isoform X2 n=1 Tax=Choristoneura fumiferana TaxID=7141 RepID=UPI003D1573E7
MDKNDWPSEYKKVPTEEFGDDKPKVSIPSSYGYGMRHVQSCLLFLCVTVAYMARAHLGVSVVAMTRPNDKHNTTNIIDNNETAIVNVKETGMELNATGEIMFKNESIDVDETSLNNFIISHGERMSEYNNTLEDIVIGNGTDTLWNVYRTYEWKKATQEMILSSFFLGYSLAMFPMGLVVQRLGGKIPIQIGLLVNGIISIVTPTVAVWGGWKAVCACRVLQGVSQSGLYPSVHTILAKWVPINERATLVGYVYTGTTLGTVIAFQLSGLLASSAAGWPSTFWVVGVTCLVAFAMVTLFSAATPSDHKTISEEEKKYIMGAAGSSKTRAKTPWKQIFSSKHVWATLVTHFFCGTCFVFLFTQIPTYMHYILGFNIKSSGLLSSLPYLACAFATMGYGVLSDFCTNRGYLSLKAARIIWNTLAQAGPALCLVAVSYTDDSALAVFLLIVALGLYAGIHSGWMVNYIDLAPNFSGSLLATGNTFSTLLIVTQPILISNIVTDVTNQKQWRIIMFLMAGMIFFSNALFVFFMSADTQPWNDIVEEENVETEMTEKR